MKVVPALLTLLAVATLAEDVPKVVPVKDGVIVKPKATPRSAGRVRTRVPEALMKVEDQYKKSKTIRAKFSQINVSVAMQTRKENMGVFLYKLPSKVRWETLSGEMSLLVSDGKRFWYYTPPFDQTEHGQVIETQAGTSESQLVQTLLAGSFSLAKDARIDQKSDRIFALTPKKGTAGTVQRALIEITGDKHLVHKVTIEHEGGNTSEVTLTDIELGTPLEDALFVFKAPPNTDKVDPSQ